jgi:hypothetical protein
MIHMSPFHAQLNIDWRNLWLKEWLSSRYKNRHDHNSSNSSLSLQMFDNRMIYTLKVKLKYNVSKKPSDSPFRISIGITTKADRHQNAWRLRKDLILMHSPGQDSVTTLPKKKPINCDPPPRQCRERSTNSLSERTTPISWALLNSLTSRNSFRIETTSMAAV